MAQVVSSSRLTPVKVATRANMTMGRLNMIGLVMAIFLVTIGQPLISRISQLQEIACNTRSCSCRYPELIAMT